MSDELNDKLKADKLKDDKLKAKRELIVQFNAEKTWLEDVDDLKSKIIDTEAALTKALTLCKILQTQFKELRHVTKDPLIFNGMSLPIFKEVSNLLNRVEDPRVGTMLERSVEMVRIGYSQINSAKSQYEALQTSISITTKMWRKGNSGMSVDDMKELSTIRVKHITVLLNSVRVK